MTGFLGDLGHGVDEIDALHEVIELHHPHDGVVLEVPLGELLEVELELVCVDEF